MKTEILMNQQKDKGLHFSGKQGSFLLLMVLLTVALIVGCEKKTYERVETTWPDGAPQMSRNYKTEEMKEAVFETHFYDSGSKRVAGPLKNEKRDGKWEAWYEDGTLWSVGYFTEGVENGTKTVYFENGKKYYEGPIKNDQRTGTWKFWDEEGKLVKEVNYDR